MRESNIERVDYRERYTVELLVLGVTFNRQETS